MSTSTKTTTARKTTKKTETAAPVAAAVVATPAPVTVAAPAPVAAPVEAAPVEEVNVVAEFNGLVEKVNKLRATLGEVFSEMKKLEKRIPRELKKASKGRRNRKAAALNEDGTEKPKKDSVFTRPNQISDDLCKFLGKAKGTQMSRGEVTAEVCAYARNKGLMEKQVIKADAPLRSLLKLTEKDELKILNLQRYLKPHYIKAAVTTA
jgi:chromatin remodeling complex protein RSC6